MRALEVFTAYVISTQWNGVSSYWFQGLPAPIVAAMLENASLFLSYSELQDVIRRINSQPLSHDLSLPQLALAGAGAGAITSFLLQVTHAWYASCN